MWKEETTMTTNTATEAAHTVGRHLGILEQQVLRGISDRLTDDRGEGVISMAIAILVIAALGVAMYTVFQDVGEAAGDKATESINNIGS